MASSVYITMKPDRKIRKSGLDPPMAVNGVQCLYLFLQIRDNNRPAADPEMKK